MTVLEAKRSNTLNYECAYPFLKWLGGKRWLIPKIRDEISDLKFDRYIELFLGGGAAFFILGIRPAVLSDINGELINAYIQVRDNVDRILKRLKGIKTDSETYYKIRNTNPTNELARAVRFIYLNRTAFSGIYRVNNKGEFNVPFGNYGNSTEVLWKGKLLSKASKLLQGTTIVCSDFERILDKAKKGDLVYCDPTYTTMHNNNGFRKYNEKCFSWADQERLAIVCNKAASRGATILVSNAYHEDLLRLYDRFEAHVVKRKSVLCPEPSKRKMVQEYLFIKNK